VPSQTAIPLVLLSNRPFDLLHVRLRTADGVLLDEIVNTRSDPSEFTHFDQRRVAGKPLAPTPMDGAHTCILLRTDARVGSAPERTGQFEVFVQGYADQSYRAKTVTFTGGYDARRPPVQFLPQSANRAHVIVPQIAGDTVVMWVHERYTGAPGCDGTPPSLDTRAVRQTPASLPREYSPSALASPDYPWDRTYSHFTVWNLDLRSSTDYTVCIRWVIEDRGEEWYLETPDGIDLYVGAGPLRHTRSVVAGTLLVRMYGVSGCFVANPHGQSDLWPKFPDQNLFGDDTYLYTFPDMCHSGGRFIGPKIQIQALFADGTNDVYGMIEVPTQVLVDNCTDVGTGQPSGPCTRRLEWRNRNVLCGGGFGTPSCQGDLFFGLDIYFRVTVRDWNNRPDPLDWGVFPIARLAPDDGGALQPVPFP
ncbi:MAG: hypothetical protein R3246_10245, partial [Acidimicrobiia bacterium]|nr:hypothetical protein [Acidimicrobiia bacterium]